MDIAFGPLSALLADMGPKSADELTSVHEALVDLLEDMPPARLSRLVCPLVNLEPREVADLRYRRGSVSIPGLYAKPRRLYPDLAFDLMTHAGERIRVVIVEVQLSVDRDKAVSWPILTIALKNRRRTDTRMLLLTPDPALRARIRRQVLDAMESGAPTPNFIRGDQIPLIHDYTQARSYPHETILGAVFHSREPDQAGRGAPEKIAALRAAFVALETFDPLDSLEFQAIVMSIAPPALVSTAVFEVIEEGEVPKSRFEQFSEVERGGYSFHRGRKEGREEGLRTMLISMLEQRFGPLTLAQLEVLGGANQTELEQLGAGALAASSIESLLARSGQS